MGVRFWNVCVFYLFFFLWYFTCAVRVEPIQTELFHVVVKTRFPVKLIFFQFSCMPDELSEDVTYALRGVYSADARFLPQVLTIPY